MNYNDDDNQLRMDCTKYRDDKYAKATADAGDADADADADAGDADADDVPFSLLLRKYRSLPRPY